MGCKHNSSNSRCDLKVVVISCSGLCEVFEKEKHFEDYFHKVWEELADNNYINFNACDDELKTGIYFICKIYHINYLIHDYGKWTMLIFIKDADENNINPLYRSDIVKIKMDMDVFNNLYQDFMKGIVPKID